MLLLLVLILNLLLDLLEFLGDAFLFFFVFVDVQVRMELSSLFAVRFLYFFLGSVFGNAKKLVVVVCHVFRESQWGLKASGLK